MTTNTESGTPRAELAHLLYTCGGDPARWPPRVRARIAALAAADPEANDMLAHARAFDRLLDIAIEAPARMSPARSAALADRIMATAMTGHDPTRSTKATSPQQPNDNVVDIRPRPQPRSLPSHSWRTAGLIAASLMAGIYLGGSLNLTPVFQELVEAAGISTVIDPAIAMIGDDLNDEETL